MNRINAFVRLDFITMKPYFALKNLLIYIGLVLFLTVLSNSGSSGMAMGIMFGVLFATYPFALGEKCNMDALYTTLSLGRKTVVSGRYLFTLVLDLCIAVAMLILSMAVALFTGYAQTDTYVLETLMTMSIMLAIIIAVQAIMLPIYFKFGYTKAKFLSLLPFGVLMAAYLSFFSYATMLGESEFSSGLSQFVDSLNTVTMVTFPLLCAALLMLISYRLSVVFYRKREF